MGYSSAVGIFSVAIEAAMIILNLLFLYSCGFVKAKREKSEIDDILMSHSICTICFILFSTPFGLMTYFRQHNASTAETCAVYQVSAIWYQILCIFVISTLVFNCVGRGYALNNSNFSHRIWSKIITCTVSIFIFFVSLNLATFPTLGLAPEIYNLTDSNVTCHLWITLKPKHQRENIFPIAYLVLGYLNLLCLIICLPTTFHYVRKVKRQLCINLCSGETNFLMERDIIRRHFINNSRMIALVAGMFYFSWIPNMVSIVCCKNHVCIRRIYTCNLIFRYHYGDAHVLGVSSKHLMQSILLIKIHFTLQLRLAASL